jgi:sugar phosphate isomerase/epimerase
MTGSPTGFVSQTHSGDVALAEWIERGSDAGFDFVELYMDGATERQNLDRSAVAGLAAEQGVDLHVHLPFVDLDLGTPRDLVRDAALDELKACLRAAADLGAGKAVVHPSSHARPPEWDADVVEPRILAAMVELDEYGEEHGVELCAENLPGGYYTLRAFDALLDATDVSMTFDTGHARVDGYDEQDVAAFLDERGDRVSHVHVNDARVDEDEHVPTGSGTTDFGTALAPLADGWEGTVSLEVYTYDFDYLEISKRKLDAALSS